MQVWLSIYHVCLGKEARRKYKWDQHSKANVMRARKYMSEVLLDQIPNLSDLQRFLDQLAISAPPETGNYCRSNHGIPNFSPTLFPVFAVSPVPHV